MRASPISHVSCHRDLRILLSVRYTAVAETYSSHIIPPVKSKEATDGSLSDSFVQCISITPGNIGQEVVFTVHAPSIKAASVLRYVTNRNAGGLGYRIYVAASARLPPLET